MRKKKDFLSISPSLLVIDSPKVASFLLELAFGQVASHDPLGNPNNDWVIPPYSRLALVIPTSLLYLCLG